MEMNPIVESNGQKTLKCFVHMNALHLQGKTYITQKQGNCAE